MDLPRAGEMTIGRDETSTVRIDDPSGGTNGTFLRRTGREDPGIGETLSVSVQQLLHRKAPIAVGDCLLFGTACVVVRRPSPSRCLRASSSAARRVPSRVLLLGPGYSRPRRVGPCFSTRSESFTLQLRRGFFTFWRNGSSCGSGRRDHAPSTCASCRPSNRDMELDSQQGRVRPDLYFRLNGVSLTIPPLRERPREIESLATSFLSAACRDLERDCPPAIAPTTMDLLRRHAWSGNVRELRNVVERAAVMCADSTILPEHLPPSLLVTGRADPNTRPRTLHAQMRAIEQRRILDAIEECDGNQGEAARRVRN